MTVAPLRAAEQCRIIQFSSFVRAKPAKPTENPLDTGSAWDALREGWAAKREAKLLELTTCPEKLTTTCKNSRLRISRRDAWYAARRLTDYWNARLEWQSALSLAQQYDVADAKTYAKSEFSEHSVLVDLWRAALVSQMLTPAPDTAAVAWKRVQLRGKQHQYSDVNPKRLQQSIDDDVQWLNDHPSRRKPDGVL